MRTMSRKDQFGNIWTTYYRHFRNFRYMLQCACLHLFFSLGNSCWPSAFWPNLPRPISCFSTRFFRNETYSCPDTSVQDVL